MRLKINSHHAIISLSFQEVGARDGIKQRAQEKKYNPPLKMLGRESKKIHPNAIWNR